MTFVKGLTMYLTCKFFLDRCTVKYLNKTNQTVYDLFSSVSVSGGLLIVGDIFTQVVVLMSFRGVLS